MSRSADFWSRRKAAVAEAEAAEEKARAEARARAEEAEAQARLEEKTDAEILEELGLKDPDEMAPGDDFAAFLKAAVPDHLRRRALRRLWRSNPVLANVDRLVEYGEDYTDAATVIENMQSAIRLGRGVLGPVEEEPVREDRPAPEKTPPQAPAEGVSETDSFPSETVLADNGDKLAASGGRLEESQNKAQDDAEPEFRAATEPEPDSETPRPRRMRFHFSD